MSSIPRVLELEPLLKSRSVLLLGPRQTGKSWLLREQLPEAKRFNLLQSDLFLSLSASPKLLRDSVQKGDVVVIDEVQRIPELLNEVHYLIEELGVRFVLSGSSARRLRRGGVNLLGGRARTIGFHPLSAIELGERFSLDNALHRGLLPPMVLNEDYQSRLSSYVDDYLQQEIMAEGAARNIPAFARFLTTAALCNAQLINFSNIANDAQVSLTTVREYFAVLEDSLVARKLEVWRESKKRKATSTAKFYFFDTGVVRHLQGRSNIARNIAEFGFALETYLHHELCCFSDYHSAEKLSFWRATNGMEVDFILGNRIAIEVKATAKVSDKMLTGLRALREEKRIKHFLLLSFEPMARKVDGIEIVPVGEFVHRLWRGDWA
ncbi:MAG: ATP-binding protein [Deltaproteobacteria bacterium]|nr:ATP-binding protein [Deltaproteobacteria bacterium]